MIAGLLVLALALRVARVEASAYRPVNDAGSYLTLASQIARTGDYTLSRRPGVGAGGTIGPSAYFPPGYPYLLAAVDLIDGHASRRDGAIQPARLSQTALGTVEVALIGLVALEAFGPAVGLVSLGMAAVYPVLIELSGILVAENLLTGLILAAVWAALRARRARTERHRYAWIALSGALAGLAALTHENGILLLIPLGLGAGLRPRGLPLAVLVGCAALAGAPWAVRNAIYLHRFIPISDEAGITLVGTYNKASAANPVVPYKWRIYYGIPGEQRVIAGASRMSEPQLDDRLQSQALHYIAQHPLAPLAAGWHNTLRLLELEGAVAWRASARAMGLRPGIASTGLIGFWIVCALAILGAFTRAARRAPPWLWLVPVLFWISVVLVNVETPRFREPIEPFLIMLAACALATAAERLRARSGDGAPVRGQRRAAVAS
jgi:4-amino-4-deoxy-L-arabinose transferase-like glycosyltransferase